MSDIVIRAENIGKRYLIGERERYLALRDVLTRAFSTPTRLFGSEESSSNRGQSHIWALTDVSFEISKGEVVGMIGRNGAGKSTLLKILARVTKPTKGSARIQGRMGTLLEVGTGFHPELTGRENTFLSGAILGMSKAEISKKFDEIVAFAEVEKFIDTPLKHFSSGMQMRLAFAVAAHLEPEILLIDEVLAVGDLEFQKKCLGKMGEVAKGGRTIIFVSHQMNQIRRLCDRILWIDAGRLRCEGSTSDITAQYEAASSGRSSEREGRNTLGLKAVHENWEIAEPLGESPNVFDSFGPITVNFTVNVIHPLRNGQHALFLYNADRQLLWGTEVSGLQLSPGRQVFTHRLPTLPLRPGAYSWRVNLYDENGLIDDWECLPELVVATKPVTHSKDEWAGLLNMASSFTLTPFEDNRRAHNP
jgi:lipopolysaccharide transport system ATP-binding protein